MALHSADDPLPVLLADESTMTLHSDVGSALVGQTSRVSVLSGEM